MVFPELCFVEALEVANAEIGQVVQPVRDPRIPIPGTMLIRKYKRRTIRVLVAADGLEFEGERYKTLSAVAKAITGTHCNGFRFFKLGDGK